MCLRSQGQVVENILLQRVQVWVFHTDEPTAVGDRARWVRGSALSSGDRTGQGVEWTENPVRHMLGSRKRQDGDRGEQALQGIWGGCPAVTHCPPCVHHHWKPFQHLCVFDKSHSSALIIRFVSGNLWWLCQKCPAGDAAWHVTALSKPGLDIYTAPESCLPAQVQIKFRSCRQQEASLPSCSTCFKRWKTAKQR